MRKGFIRVQANHFTAGANFEENKVCKPLAPIIRYMDGWSVDQVIKYCDKKKWEFEVFND